MRRPFLFVLFAVVSSVHAATYLVGTDRDLVRSATAIVVVTAGESQSVRAPRGTIETATRMHVDEVIAGPVRAGDDIDVVELGGMIDDTGLAVAGSPRFARSERMLLLLERDSDLSWTTRAMALGRFTFRRDIAGRELLVRDESELAGWDTTGAAHREPRRDAAKFLAFVRQTAAGGNPPADYFVPRSPLEKAADAVGVNATGAASTYSMQQNGQGMRWRTFPTPVTFLYKGTQPGAVNGGLPSAQKGLSAWSQTGSSIRYQFGGTTAAQGGLLHADGIDSILFNDPNKEIPGSFTGTDGDVLAVGGAWFSASNTHTFNGETFYTITEADLVVQDGIFGPGLTGPGFDHVLTHELGHTLGIRHADQNPDGSSPCTQPSCTFDAIMVSFVDFDNDTTGSNLRPWDIEAANAMYGSGGTPPPPACTPPTITTQPVSAAFSGADVALTVAASGTPPFSYQWYVGSRGDTRSPAQNGTNATLIISSLQTTTNYWVRVTGQCLPVADSTTATVTVNGCPAVAITATSPDAAIIQGHTQTLSATASSGGRPLTYKWFAGAIGDTSHPLGSGATITITPLATQTYWVLVANDCGANATSDAITITVTPCDAPQVVIQPADAEAILRDRATIAATISGTSPMQMQWYEGARGDKTHPVTNATTSSFTTDPLAAPTSFWLDATNACGEVLTNAASVTVVPSCSAPVITTQPQDTAVAPGSSAILTVGVNGPSLTYAWYQGPVFDFTHPVGRSAPALATPAITQPTQFWVRITNPCGDAKSVAATVKPASGRRRSVKP